MLSVFQKRIIVIGGAGFRRRRHLPSASAAPNCYSAGFFQCRSMAGHNKWSKIRHKKGAKDRAKAATFGKAARSISAASKDCNGDLSNLRLQSAIQHAKSIQLPKDRIEDAIQKGVLSKNNSGEDLINLRFDAMMQFDGTKVACIITALTDNRNRATQHVRTLVSKAGGEFLNTAKLSYLFHQVGLILVEGVTDEDALMEVALDAGALNVEQEEEEDRDDDADDDKSGGGALFTVTTEDTDLWQVVTALQASGYNLAQFEHRYVLQEGNEPVELTTSEGQQALEDFLEKLDENEDVENVFHNAR
jgi:YebC/PmpR family DNA-binding regulatory protein